MPKKPVPVPKKQHPPSKIIRKPVEERKPKVSVSSTERSLVRARQQKVMSLHSQGKTHDQIAVLMNMRSQEVSKDVDNAIDRLIRHYTASPQHTFVRYATFQFDIIRKLQQLLERFQADKKTVQYNAAVSALKAQSEAYDKVLEKGFSFGVISRKQASEAIRHQPQDLRAELRTEITILSRLLDEIDDPTQARGLRGPASQTEGSFTVIIRKPLRNAYGIVRALPDWKYRRRVTRTLPDGTQIEVPRSALTREDLDLLPEDDSTKLQRALLLEEATSTLSQHLPSSPPQEYPQPKEQPKPSLQPEPPVPPVMLSTHLVQPRRS